MGQESTPTISQIPEFLSLLMAASNAVAGDSGTVAQFKVDLAASLKTVGIFPTPAVNLARDGNSLAVAHGSSVSIISN